MAVLTDTLFAPPGATARRALLRGAAGLCAAGAALASCQPAHASGAVDAAPGPDAELIRLCAAYTAAVDAYNSYGGHVDPEDDVLWHAVEAIRDRVDELTARTLAGVVAKARVVRHLARQLDGSLDYGDSFTGDWPEQVVRDLLRLHGGAAA